MEYSKKALQYVGVRQGSRLHRYIIDTYNNHCLPLPRGYRMTYTDSWCATFASFVLYSCNAINPPYECSVFYMWQKALANKQVVKTPKTNDLIIYDWGANGSLDHVGIIYKIDGANLYVVEGNKSNQVGTRIINKNNKEIKGYIRVKNPTANNDNTISNLSNVVNRVIRGDYGVGNDRKKRLEKEGYNYELVQKLVNEKLANK